MFSYSSSDLETEIACIYHIWKEIYPLCYFHYFHYKDNILSVKSNRYVKTISGRKGWAVILDNKKLFQKSKKSYSYYYILMI